MDIVILDGNLDALKIILQDESDYNKALEYAVIHQQEHIVDWCITQGADISFITSCSAIDGENINILKLIIEQDISKYYHELLMGLVKFSSVQKLINRDDRVVKYIQSSHIWNTLTNQTSDDMIIYLLNCAPVYIDTAILWGLNLKQHSLVDRI